MKLHRAFRVCPRSSTVAAISALAAVLVGCGGREGGTAPPPSGGSAAPSRAVAGKPGDDGLELQLSSGKAGPAAFDRARLAAARRLPDAEATAVLQRMKPIAADPADVQSFALRPASQPPPKTGQTIQSAFPAPPSSLVPPKSVPGGELRVLRYMPEGSVPLAPQLSVTFSQPMVAVTSQGDAAAKVPIVLSPQPKGAWRWIGTRTIVFDPDVRFPQATTYRVEIPAGTASATGGVLGQTVKFGFETPPPALVNHFPEGSPQRLDVPMLAVFDQKIDPQAVLSRIAVKVAGQARAVRLLDAAEIARDGQISALVAGIKRGEQDGRWLAFRATEPLPTAATVDVEVAAGTPSAEGTNPTKAAQHFGFQTYAPLAVVRSECGWGGECRPGMAFQIWFNNPLDAERFEDSQLKITPAIPDAKIMASGNVLTVMGVTSPRTRYEVVVTRAVIDQFGQGLAADATSAFSVGDAVPTFFGNDGMVVLDPSAVKPTLDFFSTNYDQLKVQLYAVAPSDFEAYRVALRNLWNHDKPPQWPGRKLAAQLVKTNGGQNQLAETQVDLRPALGPGGLGHVIAVVEPSPWNRKDEPPPRLISWVQSTRIGIDAHVDADSLVAHASQLDTGKAASGVALELWPFGVTAKTDDRGMASLALVAAGKAGAHFLLARSGDDVAFVAEDAGYWSESGTWFRQPRGTSLAWYVADDRRLYKPGEEVSIKGWLRAIDHGKAGDVSWLAGAVTEVSYQVIDASGRQIADGKAQVNPAGGFDTRFTLPRTPNLGTAQVNFTAAHGTLGGSSYGHAIEIQEFRRPEFEVSAQASQAPLLIGGGGEVTVNAKYFAGGPLPGAPVSWTVTAVQTSFTPPNRDDYTFGAWTPWWEMRGFDEQGGPRRFHPQRSWELSGTTDAIGAHTLHLDFLSVHPALPMSVTANATVTDVNRQAWAAASTMIVHPASAYVGVKVKRPFVTKGTPFDVDIVGVDLDGAPAIGAKIDVAVVRLDWEMRKGVIRTKEIDPQSCAVVAAKDASPCSFQTREGGTYRLTATITDAQGRPNETQLTFWVTGGEQPPAREVTQERVQLIPDKKTYAAGDTAELLVQAPFYPAEGVVSWRRSGIVKAERIALDGPTTVIHVPISEAMVPDLTVQVDLVGSAARTDDRGRPAPGLPRRPAYAVGAIGLSIPPRQRTLAVTAVPAAARLAPGEKARIAVTVRDAAGHPVPGAEAAVIVVDEAILALTGYQFPDPVAAFYPARGPDARDAYSQAYIKLARPDAVALDRMAMDEAQAKRGMVAVGEARMELAKPMAPMAAAAPAPMEPGGAMRAKKMRADSNVSAVGGGGPAANSAPIAIRTNFNPLAAFSPAVHTDQAGTATVELTLPDNLTRYRVVAIAVAGERQFGKGESALTARLPLMVRPSPPRFLNFGDTFKLPVVVQNQTDAAMTVRVAVRASNAAITDGAGRVVTVPANDRVEVQFPAAAERAGTARFQIVGVAEGAATVTDAAELALPVWTPATTEAFATYGVVDDGAVAQPVALPGKVVTQFGGLEVTTASTNLAALTDAVLYLVHYPFECAEQRSSRVLAIAALKDVLAAFHARDLPSPEAMAASVAVDVEHLSQMQNSDGGFAFWDRGYPSEPYLTVYVASALGLAQRKGFAVPPQILDGARGYLRNIESHYPSYYGPDVRRAISAFALATRKQLGEADVAKGKRLLADAGGPDKLAMEANGWLLALFAQDPAAAEERKAIVHHAMNRVAETAGAANFTTSYGDGNYLLLASEHRVDAVMLDALIQDQKDSDLIPKVVTGLLAHRKAGRWLNTQENTFSLVALDRYFQTYEKATPDFVARVWLGNDYAGDHAFRGRSTDDYRIDIAMKDVASHDRAPLTIQKDGKGRLYYRIGMTYAPASLSLAAADYGFVVERRYEGVEDPKDVTRAADGTWHIKAGARVRVKLSLVNENRRYHVALVDPLPAGLEILNPALAVTAPISRDPAQASQRGPYWWWYGPWYEHQNLRDERAEAFTQLLWEGVHSYEYEARATTPGSFVVPPPRAEEMYMPETFGRGATDRVVIE